jgi:hypothetical protein
MSIQSMDGNDALTPRQQMPAIPILSRLLNCRLICRIYLKDTVTWRQHSNHTVGNPQIRRN